MSKLAFSVPFTIISNKPTTTTEEFDAFHGFMLIKNIKKTHRYRPRRSDTTSDNDGISYSCLSKRNILVALCIAIW